MTEELSQEQQEQDARACAAIDELVHQLVPSFAEFLDGISERPVGKALTRLEANDDRYLDDLMGALKHEVRRELRWREKHRPKDS